MLDDLLLTSPLAREIFAGIRDLPVYDFHNHLDVHDLATDRQYRNLHELWIATDPYKHRAMRICGVPERLITGVAPAYDKYLAWCRTLPQLIGNPLYQWSQLELARVFDFDAPLTEANAHDLWNHAAERLQQPECSARGLLRHFRVAAAAPCVTIAQPLDDFRGLDGVVPSLRGDDLTAANPAVLDALGADSWDALAAAVEARLDALHAAGCRLADHALDGGFTCPPDDGQAPARYAALRRGEALAPADRAALTAALLRLLAAGYARRGWTWQLHIGAERSTSTRLRRAAGPAGGYAGIATGAPVPDLIRLLDGCEQSPAGLPRTILYALNPADHAMLAVLSGSFPGDGRRGHLQLGPAWWFNDHAHGIRDGLEAVAAYGVLSTFVGMTTDSRNLLSFVRHEYFRRILAAWLAKKAADGEMPADAALLLPLAQAISSHNPKQLF